MKEGYGRDELPLLTGVAAGLVVAVAGAWSSLRASRGLRVASVVTLMAPLAVYLFLAGDTLVADWRGRSLARSVRISDLVATPIDWPGFDGPVGLRLEFLMEHGVSFEGNLFPPKLHLGAPASPDYFAAQDGAWLQQPLFQNVSRPVRDEPRLASAHPVRLAYELYPASVQEYDAPRRVCVQPTAESETASEGSLYARFLFVGRNRVQVDLSGPLTEALRGRGVLGGGRQQRQAMFRRFDPENLAALGFVACTESAASLASSPCLCRPII